MDRVISLEREIGCEIWARNRASTLPPQGFGVLDGSATKKPLYMTGPDPHIASSGGPRRSNRYALLTPVWVNN